MKTEILDALSKAKKAIERFNMFNDSVELAESGVRMSSGIIKIEFTNKYARFINIPDINLSKERQIEIVQLAHKLITEQLEENLKEAQTNFNNALVENIHV